MSRDRFCDARSTEDASAAPSAGSVPPPGSSRRTTTLYAPSGVSSLAASMRCSLTRCALKVDRPPSRSKDCASPRSVSTRRVHGTRDGSHPAPEPSPAGMWSPALAMSSARPSALRLAVLPPVLGPVMATKEVDGGTTKSTGTTASIASALEANLVDCSPPTSSSSVSAPSPSTSGSSKPCTVSSSPTLPPRGSSGR